MDTDTLALLAVLVSVAAAIISAWQARIARHTARQQHDLATRIHREQNEPYVIVEIEPYEPQHPMLIVAVTNTGPTIARNVRITSDPPIACSDTFASTEELQALLAGPIPAIPPGRRLTYPFDDHEREKTDLPTAYRFTVTADGPMGPVEPLQYTVDFGRWESLGGDRPTYRLEESLEGVQGDLGRIASAIAGLRLSYESSRNHPGDS